MELVFHSELDSPLLRVPAAGYLDYHCEFDSSQVPPASFLHTVFVTVFRTNV